MSVETQGVSLNGSLVNLRTVRRGDYDLLCNWREDTESMYLWTSYRHIGTRADNENELEENLRFHWHLCFIIETVERQKPIGFIYSYEAQLVDGNCVVTTLVDKEHRTRGYGVEAHALFLRYIFTYFGFRKIYSDVYDFNQSSNSILKKSRYQLEGTFPKHRYFGEAWHTMKRYAFYREDISKVVVFLDKLKRKKLGVKSAKKGGE